MWKLTILICVVLLSTPWNARSEEHPVLDVCAIMGALDKYDGHFVAVQGEILVGRHGAALVADNCSGENKRRTLAIASTGDERFQYDVTYKTDSEMMGKVLDMERSIAAVKKDSKGHAVVTGIIYINRRQPEHAYRSEGKGGILIVKDIVTYTAIPDSKLLGREEVTSVSKVTQP